MLNSRIHVVEVSSEGLLLAQKDSQWQAPWTTIESVAAGMVPYGQFAILVLAIGLDSGRVIMIGEVERVWPSLTTILADQLPGIEPFDDWATRLVVEVGTEMLYERPSEGALLH